jgi:hypothetical protein
MNTVEAESITNILQAMIQFECDLSELYRNCAMLWKSDAAFWQILAEAEIRHADHIKKMSAIIVKNPIKFEAGRPFNLNVVHTAMAGIRDSQSRLLQGAIPPEKMLILARDMEQSILESHYAEIVKTNDVEYQALIRTILAETYEHRQILQKKIAEMKGNT